MQQVTIQQAFQAVTQFLQSNRPADAENILRQMLQQDPNHPEIHHLLAHAANAQGRINDAEIFLNRAISLAPATVVYHQNLAALMMATKRPERAIELLQRAIQIDPRSPDASIKLGLIYEEREQLDLAAEQYRRALVINPNSAEAYCNLADVLVKQSKFEPAIETYAKALQINPNLAEAFANRGIALEKLGRDEEAMASTFRALQINPNMFNALRMMGGFHTRRREYELAVTYYRRAIAINSNSALGYSGLAAAFMHLGLVEQAVVECRHAIERDPKMIDPYINLGLALSDMGEHEQALKVYDQALIIEPDQPSTFSNRAIVHLVRGDFERGFADYDHRWRLDDFATLGRKFDCPRWAGSDLSGKTIVLWHEQGFGDTIHFVRYASLLADRGATVIIEVQPPLVSLLNSVRGVSQVITRSDPLPKTDFHAPFLSLPGILKTTLHTIPAEVPYVSPDPALVETWRQRVADYPGFRVGLNWTGNPLLRMDYARSIPLERFAPLADIPNVRLFNLQPGHGAAEIAPLAGRMNVIDLSSHLTDFAQTAALLANLDLVISVDTAVVHLGGAMGRPVWVLLQRWPDWRWLLDREDSPWYPSLRLFRQSDRGNWDPILDRIHAELSRVTKSTG